MSARMLERLPTTAPCQDRAVKRTRLAKEAADKEAEPVTKTKKTPANRQVRRAGSRKIPGQARDDREKRDAGGVSMKAEGLAPTRKALVPAHIEDGTARKATPRRRKSPPGKGGCGHIRLTRKGPQFSPVRSLQLLDRSMASSADRLKELAPHLVADVVLYSAEAGGRRGPALPGYGCPCMVSKAAPLQGFDAKLLLGDEPLFPGRSVGSVSPFCLPRPLG